MRAGRASRFGICMARTRTRPPMHRLTPYLLCILAEIAFCAIDGCTDSVSRVCPPDRAVAEDLEATPRADVNLELLAIAAQPFGRITADQAVYDRIVHDVAA